MGGFIFNYGGFGMNRFIALIMALTAVWLLVEIAYNDLDGWFAIFSFLLFIISIGITGDE